MLFKKRKEEEENKKGGDGEIVREMRVRNVLKNGFEIKKIIKRVKLANFITFFI